MTQPAPDAYRSLDDGVGADAHVVSQLGLRRDHRGRVDAGGWVCEGHKDTGLGRASLEAPYKGFRGPMPDQFSARSRALGEPRTQ